MLLYHIRDAIWDHAQHCFLFNLCFNKTDMIDYLFVICLFNFCFLLSGKVASYLLFDALHVRYIELVMDREYSPVINIIKEVETAILHISVL